MEELEDVEFTPPDGKRVAARAVILSAISCRGLIEKEKDSDRLGAEDLRRRLLPWLDDIGASWELEPAEAALLSTPMGQMERRATIDASWRSEGLAVLAWALHYAGLPRIYEICKPIETANGMGFLDERQRTPLAAPRLRRPDEVEYWADTYLTLHWRLRQFSRKPVRMDFVEFTSACQWAQMRLTELEVQDRDLAIDGVRIDKLEESTMRDVVSITQERRIALNWLLGFEPLYSEITTDT